MSRLVISRLVLMSTAVLGLASVPPAAAQGTWIGGHDHPQSPLGTVEEYDPAANTWTARASMPTPRGFVAAAVGPDGRIYVVGGAVAFVPDTAVEIFDLTTWSLGTPMPSARYDLGVATLGGVIYAVGGFDAGPVNTVEAYVP